MENKIENTFVTGKSAVTKGIKKYIFDMIALILIGAIIIVALGIFKVIDWDSPDAWKNFLISCIPLSIAAILLTNTYYRKGIFTGKQDDKYNAAVDVYDKLSGTFTGEQLEHMDEFCDEVNDKTKDNLRNKILKEEGITIDQYNNDFIKKGKEYKALKTCTDDELYSYGYNQNQVSAIHKAKSLKIKGLTTNVLMSSLSVTDPTNIGKNENQLLQKELIWSIVSRTFSVILLSLVTLKDITEWGWQGLLFAVMKICITVAFAYMSYFQGFNDVVINLKNYIVRKTDYLRMFQSYCKLNEKTWKENTDKVDKSESISI